MQSLKVITVKQEELKQHKQKSYNSSVDKESSGRPKVFLDLMLEMSEAGRHFTKEEFRDEVQTIISGVRVFNDKFVQKNLLFVKGKRYNRWYHLICLNDVRDASRNSGAATFLTYQPIPLVKFQEKVVEEQQDIFGNNNRAITSEDLAQMKYLEMVLKETMRMFPLIPLVARVAKQDVKLRTYCKHNDFSFKMCIHFKRTVQFHKEAVVSWQSMLLI